MDMKKDHISRICPGFSITLCFGKSGGFHFRWAEAVNIQIKSEDSWLKKWIKRQLM